MAEPTERRKPRCFSALSVTRSVCSLKVYGSESIQTPRSRTGWRVSGIVALVPWSVKKKRPSSTSLSCGSFFLLCRVCSVAVDLGDTRMPSAVATPEMTHAMRWMKSATRGIDGPDAEMPLSSA